MRTFWTALFSVIFLGSAITPGWCPQPAQATATLSGSNGATGAAVYTHKPPPPPLTPREMTQQQRAHRLPGEISAGRVKGKEEIRNFMLTGDPQRSPKNMTQQQRANRLPGEISAGRVKGKEEIRNFIATGDPKTPPPSPPKSTLPATKPASMSQATWARIQATPGWQKQHGNTAMDRLQGTQ
jgi:hypothetical protein